MTMRIAIRNADETGRTATVLVEERLALESEWKYQDRVYLGAGEEREFYIHAASRVTVTEDPSATVARS